MIQAVYNKRLPTNMEEADVYIESAKDQGLYHTHKPTKSDDVMKTGATRCVDDAIVSIGHSDVLSSSDDRTVAMREGGGVTRSDDDVIGTMDRLMNSGCYNSHAIGQLKNSSSVLDECRRLFRGEVVRLKAEVETFRAHCDSMMVADRTRLEDRRASIDEDIKRLLQEYEHKRQALTKHELQTTGSSDSFIERRQSVITAEQDLIEREEGLVKEQQRLDDYDKELEDIERNLNRREAMCTKQSNNLLALQEELTQLRHDLEASKAGLQNASSTSTTDVTTNPPRYSDIIERDLKDRQQTIEATLSRYRSELANAEAKLTMRDITIKKLEVEISLQKEELDAKTARSNQLESRLVLALSELRPSPINSSNYRRQSSTTSATSSPSMRSPTKSTLKRRHTVSNLLNSIRGRKKTVETMDSVEEDDVRWEDDESGDTPHTSSHYERDRRPTENTLRDRDRKMRDAQSGGSGVCVIM